MFWFRILQFITIMLSTAALILMYRTFSIWLTDDLQLILTIVAAVIGLSIWAYWASISDWAVHTKVMILASLIGSILAWL